MSNIDGFLSVPDLLALNLSEASVAAFLSLMLTDVRAVGNRLGIGPGVQTAREKGARFFAEHVCARRKLQNLPEAARAPDAESSVSTSDGGISPVNA